MQHLLRLCLWLAIVIGILTAHFPVSAEEDRGIRMRGPKSTDVFPYDRYGPIISKDTLWNIATRIRPDTRLTVYQVMQALYQENPGAFVDSNINYLVEGQYLKIPSFNNMMAINTNSAKIKSDNDSKSWQLSQPKVTKKQIVIESSVKKKDLETVKTEINDQLQKIDGQQQKRLENIQNDISNSIDGLQAILKENNDLRQRLTAFDDKLGVMQDEVAKGKEIKLQMDDMIQLQQALLAKAEAREKELLLAKQLAELAEQGITSSLWFIIVMSFVPAILILGLLFFLFNRRKQTSDEVFFNELESKKQTPQAEKVSVAEELLSDEELNLDDELDLSLDDELNLDNELDLSLDDELNLDNELDLSLDDELNLDNELDLSLDDEFNLDDDLFIDLIDDNDVLDGGELDQGDLDSLLSGLDDELDSFEEPESEELDGGELNQDDLNDLQGGLGELDDKNIAVKKSAEQKSKVAEITDPDDIDALLESMSDNVPAIQQGVKQDFTEAMSQSNSDMGMDEASDIYKAKEKDSTLSTKEQSLQDEIVENEEKIAALESETIGIDELGDDLDIDTLIADSLSKDEALENIQQDQTEDNKVDELDADELLTNSLSKDEVSENIQQDQTEDNAADELIDISSDEVLNTAVNDGFSESELTQLFSKDLLEGDVEQPEDTLLEDIVLSPDFNDEDILAELLAETVDSYDKNLGNTDELEIIKELDDVDFDELLANIGEESASATEDDEVGLTLDEIGGDLVGDNLIDKKIQSIEKLELTEDYVSVDDLLSESLEEIDEVEPYEKTNINVGLGQFSQNESGVDVDENGSMSSQLDLAKMYIEMNDEENAQVILQEIISKGDVIQKVEAQELLDSL